MSHKILAFAAIVAALSLLISNITPSSGIDAQFDEFKMTHKKSYQNAAE